MKKVDSLFEEIKTTIDVNDTLSEYSGLIFGFFLGDKEGNILKENVFNPDVCPQQILVMKAIKRKELIDILEAISKLGFWSKLKAGPMFNPQTYSSISRSWTRAQRRDWAKRLF